MSAKHPRAYFKPGVSFLSIRMIISWRVSQSKLSERRRMWKKKKPVTSGRLNSSIILERTLPYYRSRFSFPG